MRACVIIAVVREGVETEAVELGHGALIGRLAQAALQIDDSHVSEAHAMVSLRTGGLHLLALRRRFEVQGRTVGDVELRPGLVIDLAPRLALRVRSVRLPATVLGLRWDGGEAALLHDVAAIVTDPEPGVSWRPTEGSAVQLWRLGETWRYLAGGRVSDLSLGDRIVVGPHTFEAVSVPLQTADPTRGPSQPLQLVLFYDTVHVLRHGQPAFVIAGGGARLICELALAGVPLDWAPLARTLWTDDESDHVLRSRLDAVLRRLRTKLASGGLRDDLVANDGLGHFELRLDAQDRVEDRT